MDFIYKRLRRYNQLQIFSIGAVALVTWFAVMILVLAPLVMVALAGLGAGWASLIAVLLSLGGVVGGVSVIGRVTGQALLNREADEALERLIYAFAETKERNDG